MSRLELFLDKGKGKGKGRGRGRASHCARSMDASPGIPLEVCALDVAWIGCISAKKALVLA